MRVALAERRKERHLTSDVAGSHRSVSHHLDTVITAHCQQIGGIKALISFLILFLLLVVVVLLFDALSFSLHLPARAGLSSSSPSRCCFFFSSSLPFTS